MSSKKGSRTKFWVLAIILAVSATVIYDPSRWENTSGDTISTRYWPVSVLEHGTWKMNPWKEDMKGVIYAAIFHANGDWYPRNGLGYLPFLLPFYYVADKLDWLGTTWTHDRINRMSRWNGILLAVLTLVFLFNFLRQIVPIWSAYLSTIFFAFGTWHFSLGAQGLSPQLPAVLIEIWALHVLWKLCTDGRRKSQIWCGVGIAFLFSLLYSIRPQNMFLLMPMILVIRQRKLMTATLLTLVATLWPVIHMNKQIYGFATGFYGVLTVWSHMPVWQANFMKGLLGLLFSPNRGAITFFPILLLLPLLFRYHLSIPAKVRSLSGAIFKYQDLFFPTGRPDRNTFFLISLSGFGLYFASICFVIFWHTTWSYGSRYLYDLLPFVWPLITLAIDDLLKRMGGAKAKAPVWLHAAMVTLGIWCVGVHWLGHRNYDLYTWNSRVAPVDDNTCWNYKEFILIDVWKAGSNEKRWSNAHERLKGYGF